MFHLAGIPTYIVVAELAMNQVLSGELEQPRYPEALRAAAPPAITAISPGNRSGLRPRPRRRAPASPFPGPACGVNTADAG